MFAAAALALLVTLALALARAALGPSVFDRVLAANTVGTASMLLLAVLGFLDGRPEFLDLAIVYGLLGLAIERAASAVGPSPVRSRCALTAASRRGISPGM